MTAFFVHAENLPVYIVLLSVAGVFCVMSMGTAAIFHALNQSTDWHNKTAVEGKLEFVGLHLPMDVDWDRGKARFISKVNVGFQLRNRAPFSIDYKIKEYHATLEGRAADTDKLVREKVLTAIAGSIAASQPEPIDVSNLRKNDLKGKIHLKILYGLAGKLKYEINKKAEFNVVLNIESSVKPNAAVGVALREVD